jgi:L-seryl-tRNA(Ser) seleniumtransferase
MDTGERDRALRALPKIDELLARPDVAAIGAPRWAVREAARAAVEARRQVILETAASQPPEPPPIAADDLERRARDLVRPPLRRVINATGVILHTNLGRAPIAAAAAESALEVAMGYSNLEYDLEAGKRGSRHDHLRALVRELAGAEDAAVVNNNAGATMLALAALAHGREVIASRGELIEIGGSFRIPEVMELSGATLVEVGTTNRTRIEDYAAAINERTGLLLKVHRSNFEIVGFTEEVGPAALATLGRERGVPTMFDLGSGSLLSPADSADIGLRAEPGVREAVAAGIDVVTFSGDKLLGGPQAGILAGAAAAIGAARRHPLMRALRPDKLTIAALAATLSLYRDERLDDIPAIAMLRCPLSELRIRAERLSGDVNARLGPGPARADPVPLESAVGGGAMPTTMIPSWGIAITGVDPEIAEAALRRAPIPAIGRIVADRLVLDLRTVAVQGDEAALLAAVSSLAQVM